jgi:thioredoxin-related protein
MKTLFLFSLLLLTTFNSFGQPAAPPADSIIKVSCSEAAKENKRVFLIFHASWCVWCHKLDSSFNDYHVRDFFNRNFIVAHLTILETGVKKINENPGAQDLYRKYAGGSEASIPFWIVLDKNGNLLADSKSKTGTNTGCPATIEEVQHFLKVLKQTSDMNAKEEKDVEQVFRSNDQ